jgi:hypothetical protein
MCLASRLVLSAVLSALVAGCGHGLSVPRPERVEPYCGNLHFSQAALARVVGSFKDIGGSTQAWPQNVLMQSLKSNGGVIAYWDDLKVPSPYMAASQPRGDGSYHAQGVMVLDHATPGPYFDRIYLLMRIPRKPSLSRWLNFQTLDRENVCKWLPL